MNRSLLKLIENYPELRWKIRISGLFLIALGLWCATGHLVGQPFMYEMNFKLGMGFPTAIGFVVAGNAFILISLAGDNGAQKDQDHG